MSVGISTPNSVLGTGVAYPQLDSSGTAKFIPSL